jgi:DUF917 family protein
MPRVIREQELSDIIIGAGFMGAGGVDLPEMVTGFWTN